MLYVSALRYSANVNTIISPARRASTCFHRWFAPQLECDLAVHAHFGRVVVCRHCLSTYPHRKKSQSVRSGDLGGQSSNLFERPCIENIYWDCKGRISSLLNSCLQKSLLLDFVLIRIIRFWILKISVMCGEFPPKNYTVCYYWMYIWIINHFWNILWHERW